MYDAVRAEVSSVASLKAGIERFGVHISKALDESRAQMRTAQHKAQHAVEQRRKRVDQTSRAVAQAEAVFATCAPEARAQAAQAIATARAANAEAKAQFGKARTASADIDRSATELLKSLSAAQSQIESNAGSGKSYLRELEAHLKRIAGGGNASHADTVAETVVMIGKAVVDTYGVDALLSVAEKAAHAEGMFQEVGGLAHDAIDTIWSIPLDERGGSIEIGREG